MLTLNKVMLCGRLVADPELKTTPSNISVTSFRLAVDRGFTKQGEEKQTDFIDVVCWRQTAEFVSKYFKKGSAAYVGGSIQTRSWKDKEGNSRKTVEVVADEVKFAESKRDSGKSDSDTSFSNVPSEDFHEIGDDDELPF